MEGTEAEIRATAARAFDAVAQDYDRLYGPQANQIMAWMRRESLAVLRKAFVPGGHLLEIGCGIGDEALDLARAGHRILATDVSPAMCRETQARARAAGLEARVQVLALPAGLLHALRPSAPFDGGYASFGSLNCEPALSHVAGELARLLRPGARFVCSVMARWCPVEVLWFALHGQISTALRRFSPGWQTACFTGPDGTRRAVPVRYLSPGDVAAAFAPHFTLERALSLPLLLPPPYLDHLFRRHRRFFARLEPWERRLRAHPPWHRLGDHVLLVLRRTETHGGGLAH